MIKTNLLHPWFITGLIDAEGSFGVAIIKDDSRSSGFAISIFLEMGLNFKDKDLLLRIKNTLGVGNIYHNKSDNTFKWKVSNLSDISNVILPFLNKYSLVTQKRADYEIFTQIAKLLENKQHMNCKGLQDIVNLKASLNLGLKDKNKTYFPNTIPVPKHTVPFKGIPDSFWLAGFAEGEACFYLSIYKSLKSKLGYAVQLVFKITQHNRDNELLKGISEYLACGRVENRKTNASDFTVNSFKSFEEKIIPFFTNYPLQGSKLLNFQDFKEVVGIMKDKGHLNKKGLQKINLIKSNMNFGREENKE